MRTAFIGMVFVLLSACVTFPEGPLDGAPSSARFVDVDATRVHYVDLNAEAPQTILLLHGFGATLDEWRDVAPELVAAGYRVLLLDLRGFGWSSRSADANYSIEAQADLALAVVRERGVERFDVVGHSWGSAVALAVATKAPQAVERIVLFNGMVFDDQQPTLFDWARVPVLGEIIFGLFYRERTDEKMALAFYDADRFVTQAAVERVEASQDRAGATAAALATIRAIDLSALELQYRTIRQETLILWGREDQITPLETGERLRNELPAARLIVFPRCGHLPMIELPGPSAIAMLRFLGEASP